MLGERENMLRAIEYRRPEWIPIQFVLMASVIAHHGARLVELMSLTCASLVPCCRF
jgi:hypothetical protein